LDFRLILLIAPVMLFSIIAHEYAHGYAALKQGDTTALSLGRLTWNPIKHIDPILTIALPLLLAAMHGPIIGGAKPVPVNPNNYRNFRRGDIIVSLAGVTTNIIIAICCTIVVALVGLAAKAVPALIPAFSIIQAMMLFGILLNFSLVVFNLLPIPPLDGSHVVKHFLPPSWAIHYQRIGFAGIIILLLLMRVGFIEWWFTPALLATQYLSRLVDPLILSQASAWIR
jgi:Zn-dependent protease